MREVMEEYSTTFYECMKGFPAEKQEDIYRLYAYLRVIDEMVEGDYKITDFPNWREVIEEFHVVCDKYQFKGEWLQDFHESMFTDMIQREHTVTSMLDYCKGSAESVGMMMSKILGCHPRCEPHARALGRAFQVINFIRDYDEDVANGYHYITDNFSAYLEIFYQDLDNGMDGIDFIPKELQPPILMAVEKYMAVAKKVSEA